MTLAKTPIWPVLGKLSEQRENTAFSRLLESRQKLADCLRRENRLEELREDYEKRYLVAGSGRIQSVRDLALCRGFIEHVDGLKKLIGQKKSALTEVQEVAQRAFEDAQREKMKWHHLEQRDLASERSRRAVREQRKIDEVAATRFVPRKLS